MTDLKSKEGAPGRAPSRSNLRGGGFSKRENTTKSPAAATIDDALLNSAANNAILMAGIILDALNEGDQQSATSQAEILREELALEDAGQLRGILTHLRTWITTNANGHQGAILELAGLPPESEPTITSSDIAEAIVYQGFEAARLENDLKLRRQILNGLLPSIALLDAYALSLARASFTEVAGIDKRTFDNLLASARRGPGQSDAPGPKDVDLGENYTAIGGAFHVMQQSNDGVRYPRPLCNFTAYIVEDVTQDDGQAITRRLVIAGRLAGGQPLPRCQVDAAQFGAMNWVMTQWGSRAVVNAGQSTKDKLREVIQRASRDAARPIVYTHTGWREIDGKRVYLTAAGAVGSDQPITVKLEGQLAHYALPTNLADVDAKKAMQASLRTLAIAPFPITFALWGAMYLAPLAELLLPDFMIWLHGESGGMKSTLAAFFLCHFGKFTYKTLPEGWDSTENAIEKKCFLVKDAPLVIDDFAPQMAGNDIQRIERSAQRIIRAVGNQTPRNRLNADTSDRLGYRARGLVISTGEQLPSTASIMARLLPVEVKREMINLEKLNKAQDDLQLLPGAMAGYILWLAGQWQELSSAIDRRLNELRAGLSDDSRHLRNASTFAALLISIDLALEYAQVTGALTPEKRVEYFNRAKTELQSLAEEQADLVRKERPSLRFIAIIRDQVTQGKCRFAPLEDPEKGGSGDLLGWYDDDWMYVLGEATYHLVKKFCRDEGEPFVLKPSALYSMLEKDGVLIKAKDRSTTVVKVQGKPQRVLQFVKLKAGIL